MSELKEDQTAIRIPLQTKRPPRFHLNDEANQQAMLKYLEEEGYAVIASAASVEQVEKAKELFWAYHEMVGSNAKRDDPSTWDSQNWIGSKDVGIIRSPSFCHSEFLWFARTLPKVKQCFGLIWNDEDLLVSFDAGNAYRPWRYDPQWVTQGNWWHVDQNSLKGKSREGKVCVQGLMSFYDATEESGGLCVVPRSHHLHNEVCTRNSNSAKMMYDYVYLDSRDPALQSEQAVLLLAEAGDFIVWDSRLVHCNTPGLNAPIRVGNQVEVKEQVSEEAKSEIHDLLRLVAYICMLPRRTADAKVLDHKKRGFLAKTPTSHWPNELIHFIPEEPDSTDLSTFSNEVLELVGFSKSEIRRKQFDNKLCSIC